MTTRLRQFVLQALCIVLFLTVMSYGQAQEEANERANSGALKFLSSFPRYGGDSSLDVEDIEEMSELGSPQDSAWLTGVLTVLVIPIVLLALSVLLCPFFTLCRCCKCCCCKKTQPKEAITKFQIYSIFAVIFACAVAIVAMASVAYGANIDFSGALLDNTGEGAEGNLFSVAENLLYDGASKLDDILTIVETMEANILWAIDGVQEILGDTSILSSGASSLVAMLYSISATWSDYNVTATSPSNNATYTFECAFCTTFSSQVSNITDEISAQTVPTFAALNDTVQEIDSALIDSEDVIVASIDTFASALRSVGEQLADAQDSVLDARGTVDEYNEKREQAYMAIFVVPLLPIVFILFGGILLKSACFSIAYVCLWFSCTLMWLLLMVHWPLAVIMHDSCALLNVVDSNISAVVDGAGGAATDSAIQVFQACLDNTKLTEVFDVDLDFVNEISFPTLDIGDSFSFAALTSFEQDAFAVNFSTFYAQGDVALLAINNLTSSSPYLGPRSLVANYSRDDDISTLNSSAYWPVDSVPQQTLEELKGLLLAEQASIDAFNATVFKIRANLTAVNTAVAEIEGDVQSLTDRVNNASLLLDPLFVNVETMVNTTRCGFIGDAYYDTKAVMCEAVLGSLARIVLSMFVIAILSIVSCVLSFKMVRRVEWYQKQKKDEKQQKLQQSMQPNHNKPNIIIMQQNPDGSYQPGGGNAMHF